MKELTPATTAATHAAEGNTSRPGHPTCHPGSVSPLSDDALLTSCVHCGFCLEVCPTYKLTGDENNSPRGRLRLWREEADGRLEPDPWTAHYTAECVGCLACETACPANVPYGRIFEQARHEHVSAGRTRPSLLVRGAAALTRVPLLFDLALLPARWLRRAGWLQHSNVFQGRPAVMQSTAEYARRLVASRQPTGPRVALLTGCLMEGLFREINFATVRVLVENNCRVVIPTEQSCCGAFHEHAGLGGVEALRATNRRAFEDEEIDVVVTNSSGCGLALARSLVGHKRVVDVLTFLGELDVVEREPRLDGARVYVDLPCHLVHGQRAPGIPARVLDATGYHWELAPQARDCCGSGGIYHLERPENAREILRSKSAFLEDAPGDPVILATANHVCMMQWNSAGATGLVRRPFEVRHVIQMLDPGEEFAASK